MEEQFGRARALRNLRPGQPGQGRSKPWKRMQDEAAVRQTVPFGRHARRNRAK